MLTLREIDWHVKQLSDELYAEKDNSGLEREDFQLTEIFKAYQTAINTFHELRKALAVLETIKNR